eukprot:6100305-Pyramimonas_sp.AAC.1
MVQRAIKQCITLNNFIETLRAGDVDRDRIYEWLFPNVPQGNRGWSCISPLNILNYVLLYMKSRYAAMAASAMVPLLYWDSKPHAVAGIVLQGWLQYVDIEGPITWKQFVNIGHHKLPNGRPTIETTVDWIRLTRDDDRPETIFFWFIDFDARSPPQETPYAT